MCLNSQTLTIGTSNQQIVGEGICKSNEINKEKLIDILDQVILLLEEDDVFPWILPNHHFVHRLDKIEVFSRFWLSALDA